MHQVGGGWSGDPGLVAKIELAAWGAPSGGLPLSPAGPWVLPDDGRWPLACALAATGWRCTVGGRDASAGLEPVGPSVVA